MARLLCPGRHRPWRGEPGTPEISLSTVIRHAPRSLPLAVTALTIRVIRTPVSVVLVSPVRPPTLLQASRPTTRSAPVNVSAITLLADDEGPQAPAASAPLQDP